MNTSSSRAKAMFTFRLFIGVALAWAALANPGQAHAVEPMICRVDAAAAVGGDGATWATAFNSLQTALGDAACYEIWVKAGVYKPGALRTDTFQLSPGIEVYGGFDGTETLRTQRSPAAHVTTLSGDIDGSNSYHVVSMDGTTTNVTAYTVLDGFTVTRGEANGLGMMQNVGGGLYCKGSGAGHKCSPTLARLIFNANTASNSGGAVYNDGSNGGVSSPSLTDVTFSGNHADSAGGALYNDGYQGNSSPTLTNVTFSTNSAMDGGAVYNSGYMGYSSPTLTNVTFSGNYTTDGVGGAMFNGGNTGVSSPSLTNVTLSGNGAYRGGGIYNEGTNGQNNTSFTNVILWGNTAASGGSQIYNSNATPSVNYSIVQGGDAGIGGNSGLTAFSSGTGNLNVDPKLNALGNYGGYTKTMTLQKGSPAIDRVISCAAKDQRGIVRPQDGDGNGTKLCDLGATESRYPTTVFNSGGTYDGWVLESTETSGVGGTRNSGDATLRLGDDASRKQYRSILSFNTSILPDTAQISGVKLKFRRQGITGGGSPISAFQGIMPDFKKGTFGTAALEIKDFQATATSTTYKTFGPFWPTPDASGWYTISVASAKGYINLLSTSSGLTQIRLRFKLDDNANTVANYLSLYSGNAASTDRPKLILTYYVP